MRKLDTHHRPATSNTSNGDEMLPKTPQHIVHRTHVEVRNRIERAINNNNIYLIIIIIFI